MKIKKSIRVKFISDVKKYLLSLGAEEAHDRYYNLGYQYILNGCYVSIRNEDQHGGILSIFCRFENKNILTGPMNPKYNWDGFEHDSSWINHIDSIKEYKHG